MLDSSPYILTFVYRVAAHYLQDEHRFYSDVQPYVSKTTEESVLTRNNSVVTIKQHVYMTSTNKFHYHNYHTHYGVYPAHIAK